MKVHTITTLLFLLISTAFGQETDPKIERAQQTVRDLLKDPDSAKFKDLEIVVNTEQTESVVGKVNGRNSYGGYTGYKPFCVTHGVATLVDVSQEYTLDIYRLTGAWGEEEEMKVRLKHEKQKFVKKLEDQANFSCEVIWTLLTNTIVEKQPNDEALDAAIAAMKARAISNGAAMHDVQATQLRKLFEQSLLQTLGDKKQVKAIRRNPDYQKKLLFPIMYNQTLNSLKLQYEAAGY